MELDNLKTMWRDYDSTLEKSLNVNLHTLSLIQTQKVKSTLGPLYWQRVIEISSHTIVIVLLSIFCYYHFNEPRYTLPAYVLLTFYSLAFKHSFLQIKNMYSISADKNIISMQASLASIQSGNLHFVRLSVLFIPALLSFPVVISKAISDFNLHALSGFDIIQQTNGNWWTAEIIASVILIPLGIWFYREINYKNVHKRWVNRVIEKASGIRVRKALEYIKELELLRHGTV